MSKYYGTGTIETYKESIIENKNTSDITILLDCVYEYKNSDNNSIKKNVWVDKRKENAILLNIEQEIKVSEGLQSVASLINKKCEFEIDYNKTKKTCILLSIKSIK